MNRLPRWRIAAAIFVLAGLLFFLGTFAPIYYRNLQLHSYVADLTRNLQPETTSDALLRTRVVTKARQLNLPVADDNVHILHTADGIDIQVRYFVRVDLPGYTVDLHFYPGASSR